jgi:hypothetical protein
MTSHSTTLRARHTFSIASAPFKDELVVATRMRDSAFKRALGALPIGIGVAIEGPFGSQGPIDEPLLMRATAELTRPIYCVAGPPAMAEGLRLTLGDAGVADDTIRSEEFYGY